LIAGGASVGTDAFGRGSERDQGKPPILLELKYRSVEDATMQLGGVGGIRDAFTGFQRHLYD